MSTPVTPLAHRHFEICFRPPAPVRSLDAWQGLIGKKPIGARIEWLPEHHTNWRALAISTFSQAAVVIVFFLLQMFMPQSIITKVQYEVMPLAASMVEIPTAKPRPAKPKVQPRPVQTPQPQQIANLIVLRPLLAPKPKPVELRNLEVPKVEQVSVVPKLDVPDLGPVRPREVKTSLLGDLRAGGGFGDPRGLLGAADPRKAINQAHVGAFDSAVGLKKGSGKGDVIRPGGNGVSGSVFSNGDAFAAGKSSEGPRAVRSSGFQSPEITPPPAESTAKAADAPTPTQAVLILSKPNPVYTDEARRLGIEGEVLVDVVFLATGEVRVEGVSKGLGHGLDEAAIRAAQQIRFKPAVQDGHAVDFPARVHVVFQIAF